MSSSFTTCVRTSARLRTPGHLRSSKSPARTAPALKAAPRPGAAPSRFKRAGKCRQLRCYRCTRAARRPAP
eukprot:9687091-Alexandrium_andersonii.AAC.1